MIGNKMNEKIWQNFKKSFEKGKMSHAYIFCGLSGTGKFEMLEKVIAFVNKKEFFLGDQNIILLEREIEEKKGKIRKKDISVEQVRHAIQKASFFTNKNEKKFLIVKEADRLNKSCSNILLKTMEEPKNDTIVILLCEYEKNLLATIRSRCQKIFFNLAETGEVENYLREKYPDEKEESVLRASCFCRGRHRLAEELLKNPLLLDEKSQDFENFKKAIKSSWGEAFELVEKVIKDKEKMFEMIDEWVWSLREFLRENLEKGENEGFQVKVIEMIKCLAKIKNRLKNSNANEKLQLESFFVKMM